MLAEAVEAIIIRAGTQIIAGDGSAVIATAGKAAIQRAGIIVVAIGMYRAGADILVQANTMVAGISGAGNAVINNA